MRSIRLPLAGVALALAASRWATAAVVVEVYTDRASFESRLGGAVRTVDFDDVDTSAVDPVAFAADRYAATRGVVITGESGQYASQTFDFPAYYPTSSPPNFYAPGPPEENGGGNQTRLDFLAGSAPAAVAGVGLVFVDPDFPVSSLTILDRDGSELRVEPVPVDDGGLVFCGLVAVDDLTGAPVPVIAEAQIVNGNGWPAGFFNEGVPLDDLVFGVPVPLETGATTTTTTTVPGASTTSTTLTTLCAPSPLSRCRKPRASGKSVLFVRNVKADADDRFVWRWAKGAETRAEDFGDPLTRTAFVLCAYDASGLRLALTTPPGGSCRGGACWRRTRVGFVYAGLTPDGVAALVLRESQKRGAKIVLKGRGPLLRLPALPFVTPVTVQLLQADERPCWDARYTAATKASATRFKALSD